MQKNAEQEAKVKNNLGNITHKLFVLSGKGGVGKSTVSVHLSIALAEKGYKVGLLDSDIHGPSTPKILGIEQKKPKGFEGGIYPVEATPNLRVMSMAFLLQDKDSPVIWRGPLKMAALKQFIGDVSWGKLDFLIVDLPPGTGDEPLSIAQLIPESDGAIIVTTPQDVALVSVRKSINFVKKMDKKIIGIIENMSGFTCPHCGKTVDIFKTGGGKKASEDFGIPFLGKIPLDPEIVQTGDAGKPFLSNNNPSEAAQAFQQIVNNIENIVKKIGG
jgi:ATP-binding protein involved in chromosome partitioning